MTRWIALFVLIIAGAIALGKVSVPVTPQDTLEKSHAYLAKNAARPEVMSLPSGLQIEVLREGAGAQPSAKDVVLVHYKGWLLDGTVFDSSYERKSPAVFGVSEVIPGWSEGLQHMKVGGKYRLVVPSELAYGQEGAGGVIPPNAVLSFDVELLAVKQP